MPLSFDTLLAVGSIGVVLSIPLGFDLASAPPAETGTAFADILKNWGEIKYTLILLGRISYGTCSPFIRNGGIYLIIHWKIGFYKKEQVCLFNAKHLTNLFVFRRRAYTTFFGCPFNRLVFKTILLRPVCGMTVALPR